MSGFNPAQLWLFQQAEPEEISETLSPNHLSLLSDVKLNLILQI
jgi:hypothetical protein